MQRRRCYTHLYFPLRPTLFSASRESFRYMCDYGYCIILGLSCHAVVHSGTLSSLQFANMEEALLDTPLDNPPPDTPPPKPKRLKTEYGDEVKTVLFLIHHHSPFMEGNSHAAYKACVFVTRSRKGPQKRESSCSNFPVDGSEVIRA